MANYLNPWSARQFVDANSTPYSGAKLFTYVAGSSTKVTTYKDSAGVSNHANPIILNTKGEPADVGGSSQPIWQAGGAAVKLVLAPAGDTDPPTSPISTWDNIAGINDATLTIDQWIVGPAPIYVGANTMTLVGDQTSVFHVGRRVKTINTSGTVYSTITNSVFTTLTTLILEHDSGSIDSGLSAISYGIASAENSSLPFITDIPRSGVLVKDGTNLRLNPKNGNRLMVNRINYKIPSAGVAMSPASLAASTVYYIYAYISSGTMTLEASATGHSVDSITGVEIKTGDSTRTLVGMARTDGAVAWETNVRSWYNDNGYVGNGVFSTDRTTIQTSLTEINSEIRTGFLCWSGEIVSVSGGGTHKNSNASSSVSSRLAIDTTQIGPTATEFTDTANQYYSFSLDSSTTSLSEGYHYLTIYGNVATNTGTWSSTNVAINVSIG
jgi:hypothetical protein